MSKTAQVRALRASAARVTVGRLPPLPHQQRYITDLFSDPEDSDLSISEEALQMWEEIFAATATCKDDRWYRVVVFRNDAEAAVFSARCGQEWDRLYLDGRIMCMAFGFNVADLHKAKAKDTSIIKVTQDRAQAGGGRTRLASRFDLTAEDLAKLAEEKKKPGDDEYAEKRAMRARQAKFMELAREASFWRAVCFETEKDARAFAHWTCGDPDAMNLNGVKMCVMLGIALPPAPEVAPGEPWKPKKPKFSKQYAELVTDLRRPLKA